MCCAEVLTLVFDMLSMEIDAKLSVIFHFSVCPALTSACCFIFCRSFSTTSAVDYTRA